MGQRGDDVAVVRRAREEWQRCSGRRGVDAAWLWERKLSGRKSVTESRKREARSSGHQDIREDD
jgi:hypothetical protein